MRRARKTTAQPDAPPADWPDALARFDAHLVELERSHHTREDYRDDLENFARWYQATFEEPPDLAHIEAKELRQWKDELRDRRKLEPATVNRKLSAIRSLLKWAQAKGWAAEIATPKAVRQAGKPPRWLTTREQRALLRAAQKYRGLRDAALIRLLLHTGLRVEEACALTTDDYEIRDRGGSLTVRKGKGRKQRVIPLNSEARKAIEELESTYDQTSPHLLKGQRGPLTPRGVQDLMSKIARRAGLPPITPHDLRHTFGHELAVAGVSIQEIADLMGHESLETTRRYVQPGQEDLAAAVQRLAGSED